MCRVVHLPVVRVETHARPLAFIGVVGSLCLATFLVIYRCISAWQWQMVHSMSIMPIHFNWPFFIDILSDMPEFAPIDGRGRTYLVGDVDLGSTRDGGPSMADEDIFELFAELCKRAQTLEINDNGEIVSQ